MEVLASNTHVFNSGAEFITHFLNFPARATALCVNVFAALAAETVIKQLKNSYIS